MPPPRLTKGSEIAQPVGLGDGIGVGAGVGVGAGAESGGVTTPGLHPPLTHVPPPIETNGSGVEHPTAVGAGAGAGRGWRRCRRWSWRGTARSPPTAHAGPAADRDKGIRRRAAGRGRRCRRWCRRGSRCGCGCRCTSGNPAATDARASADCDKRIGRRAAGGGWRWTGRRRWWRALPTTRRGSGDQLIRRAAEVPRINNVPVVQTPSRTDHRVERTHCGAVGDDLRKRRSARHTQ